MTERMTISMDDELAERINGQLSWGDNRSELVRELLREALDARESDDDERQDKPQTAIDSSPPPRELEPEPAPQTPLPEGLPAGLDEGEVAEAVDAVVAYLRDEGSATMRDIVRDVMPDYPLGYDVNEALEKIEGSDRFRGAWWRSVIKPALEHHNAIKKPPQGRSEWRYVGDG